MNLTILQNNGNVLDEQQAMRLINGLTGPVPVPRMAGLGTPAGVGPGQTVSLPSQQPSRPAPAPPARSGTTEFPPLSPDKASVYQTAFEQLDTDKDGLVQGVDCFATFMRSGLPKSSLKEIWDLVAGEQGQLNRHQFVQCLYLIECVKAGIPLPTSLPRGQFPPVTQGVASMMTQNSSDIYSGPTLTIPTLPDRAVYAPAPAPQVAFQSAVPPPLTAEQSSQLSSQEMERLQKERESAVAQEAERHRAEEQRVAAAARREFYTKALAELRVSQGKVSRMLVEAQQRLEMEKSEAEEMESQYNAAYEAFSTEHAKAAPLLESMKAAEEEKTALKSKMNALEAAIAQLKGVDENWEEREKAEIESLHNEIALLVVKHESLQKSAAAIQSRCAGLESIVNGLQTSINKSKESILPLQTKVREFKSQKELNGEKAVELLRELAPLYNELYSAARGAMLPLPKEALASIVRPSITEFKYDALRFSGDAAELEKFDDEGFTISSALPMDNRLVSLISPSLASADVQQEEDLDVQEDVKQENQDEISEVKDDQNSSINESEADPICQEKNDSCIETSDPALGVVSAKEGDSEKSTKLTESDKSKNKEVDVAQGNNPFDLGNKASFGNFAMLDEETSKESEVRNQNKARNVEEEILNLTISEGDDAKSEEKFPPNSAGDDSVPHDQSLQEADAEVSP